MYDIPFQFSENILLEFYVLSETIEYEKFKPLVTSFEFCRNMVLNASIILSLSV